MRHGRLVVCLLAAALALSPPRAPAAAEPAVNEHVQTAGEADKGPAHAEHAASDPFSRALDLTIWTVVVFVVLLLVLRRFAWGPMLRALQQREKTIHDSLEQARQEREAAERLRADLQRQMDQAHDKVRQLLDEARRDARRSTDEMLAETRSQMQAERQRLHREIDTARDQALQQLWARTAELAALVSSRAIRRQLTPDDHRRLVEEALAELNQAGAGADGARAGA
jgi:F-type H+-transporting ATPase subunit b